MTDKEEKTIMELEKDEVAFVMNAKGDIKIHLPHMDNENNVPEYVQFMSAIAVVCISDVEVIELIWKKFHELVEGAQ